jgi:hypothetical protein
MRVSVLSVMLFAAVCAAGADRAFTSYATARPVLDRYAGKLPANLRNPDEAKWNAWSRAEDKAIRERLQQGDLESMVNLLLFGTSFTKQPRVKVEEIVEASRSGVLRARVDDLIAGLANPGANERLAYFATLLRGMGIDPAAKSPEAGVFIYDNVRRVLEQRRAITQREQDALRLQGGTTSDAAAALDERSGLFRDRGVSLDTSIFPNFSIEQALRALKSRGLLREGQVTRVAVIGPGLEVIDKNDQFAFDYYPQQMLQPFALFDSLLRLGLSRPKSFSQTVFDISPTVIDHLDRARARARKNTGYLLQLPRAALPPWPPELVDYWRALGDRIGSSTAPIQPPPVFRDMQTRAVRITPEAVLACQPQDLDIVFEHLNLAQSERFDLIVATNIFIYYDSFEQALALQNVSAMLKPGGVLLTNDRLPELPDGSMPQAGITDVHIPGGESVRDAVVWYRRR